MHASSWIPLLFLEKTHKYGHKSQLLFTTITLKNPRVDRKGVRTPETLAIFEHHRYATPDSSCLDSRGPLDLPVRVWGIFPVFCCHWAKVSDHCRDMVSSWRPLSHGCLDTGQYKAVADTATGIALSLGQLFHTTLTSDWAQSHGHHSSLEHLLVATGHPPSQQIEHANMPMSLPR